MAKKFYAVRVGYTPGIYTTYDEANRQVEGFSSAEWKGFNVRQKAEEYMGEVGEVTAGSTGHVTSSSDQLVFGNGSNTPTSEPTPSHPLPSFGGLSLDQALAPAEHFLKMKNQVIFRRQQLKRLKSPREIKEGHKNLARAKIQLLALEKERIDEAGEHGAEYFVWLDMMFDNFQAAYLTSQFDYEGIVPVNDISEAQYHALNGGYPRVHGMYEEDLKTVSSSDGKKEIYKVYIDGACSHNGSESAEAGIGVYFGNHNWKNVFEPLFTPDGSPPTNQLAELTALKRAYQIISEQRRICNYVIYTDSAYVIDCVTKWCLDWETNGWKNSSGDSVVNADLIKEILKLKKALGHRVELKKVEGHSGDRGNDEADELARKGIYRGRFLTGEDEEEE